MADIPKHPPTSAEFGHPSEEVHMFCGDYSNEFFSVGSTFISVQLGNTTRPLKEMLQRIADRNGGKLVRTFAEVYPDLDVGKLADFPNLDEARKQLEDLAEKMNQSFLGGDLDAINQLNREAGVIIGQIRLAKIK